MRIAVFALLFPLLLAAQQPRSGPPRQRPAAEAQKPQEPATVEGQVLNAATGEPLKRASVTLRRSSSSETSGAPRGYTAMTDASGRFAIAGAVPGEYRLSARRNGFVDADYGSRDYLRAGATVTLKPGQRMGDVVFQMTPHGVITGRVVDEDGEPVAGVRMQALRNRYPQGRRQLVEYGEGGTNDIGEYRIAGLPPGRYYISASPRRNYDRGMQAAGAQPEEEYATTFFPGTSDAAAAAAVDMAAGSQLRGLDLTLRRHRTVYVRGRVTGFQSSGRQRVMLFLRPRGAAAPSMNRPGNVDSNGNFEFRGVAPGSYMLVAAVPERGRGGLTARLPVEVGNASLENIGLALNPPLNVAGRVMADSQTVVNLAGVEVSLRPLEPVMFGPSTPPARVQQDGTFSFANVSADEYMVTLSGLPDGFYVKVVAAGGQNVQLSGIDLNRGIAGGVEILLSPHAGQVTGVAQNGEESVAGATVVMIPQEKERRGLAQYYRTASADAAGRFAVKNLDPGQYRIFAWRELEAGAYFDPDFMRAVENQGEPVSIREDGREEVKVRVIG